MNAKLLLPLILLLSHSALAQSNQYWLSASAGPAFSSSSAKAIGIGNGYSIQAEAYLPFYQKKQDFSLGAVVSGNYAGLKTLMYNRSQLKDDYPINGGELSFESLPDGGQVSSLSGFAGLGAMMFLGRWNVGPSLSAGYIRLIQQGFTQRGSISLNDQAYNLLFTKVEDQRSTGFAFKPQLKIGYQIAQNLSVFVSHSIVVGPKLSYASDHLIPVGNPDQKGNYEMRQFMSSTWETRLASSRYKVNELTAGVSFAIGKIQSTRDGFSPSHNLRNNVNQPLLEGDPLFVVTGGR